MTRKRNKKGSAVSDLPLSLWILIIGLLFPLIGFLTVTLRVICIYYGAGDASYQAAKQQTYTEAQTRARAVFLKDAAIPGVTVPAGSPAVKVVRKNKDNGEEYEFTGIVTEPINTGTFVYLLRVQTSAQVDPIINFGGSVFPWANIPGLSGPIDINFNSENVAENPDGLIE